MVRSLLEDLSGLKESVLDVRTLEVGGVLSVDDVTVPLVIVAVEEGAFVGRVVRFRDGVDDGRDVTGERDHRKTYVVSVETSILLQDRLCQLLLVQVERLLAHAQ